MTINITSLDHLVLTVASIDRTIEFYTRILGMEKVVFAGKRVALRFGQQKINLHQAGGEFPPHAKQPLPGSADICLLTDTPLCEVQAHFKSHHIPVIEGPVERTGASGRLLSIYIRDPDQNLIEIANVID